MKNTPRDSHAHDMMNPGTLTASGFLGNDTRSVSDIIAADEKEFARLGLDFDKVADELARLRNAGGAGLGEPVTVDKKFLVQTGDARGMLPCPFGDGLHHKNACSVRPAALAQEAACVESDDMLIFSDLSIHLLRAHHFCQGRGSPFRLAPEHVKRILFS